jgi:DNA-binding transcriptional ArsR family regulator
MMSKDQKNKVLQVLEKAYTIPGDLSIGEIARAAGMSDITASKYVSVLEAEGKIEISRRVGRAVFYRIKKGKAR